MAYPLRSVLPTEEDYAPTPHIYQGGTTPRTAQNYKKYSMSANLAQALA